MLKSWGSSHPDSVYCRVKEVRERSPTILPSEDTMRRNQLKTRERVPSREHGHSGALILDCQPAELWEVKFHCSLTRSTRYFVIAVWGSRQSLIFVTPTQCSNLKQNFLREFSDLLQLSHSTLYRSFVCVNSLIALLQVLTHWSERLFE